MELTNDKYGQMAETWFTIPQNRLTLRVANSWRELEVSNVLPGKIVILVMLWLSSFLVSYYMLSSYYLSWSECILRFHPWLGLVGFHLPKWGWKKSRQRWLCFIVWWAEQQKWGLKQLDVVILYGSKKKNVILFQRAKMWIFNVV